MIRIICDTREQKTPILLDMHKQMHPKIHDDLEINMGTLKAGTDFYGNNQMVQIKWGQDLYSSLNNGKLEEELIEMKKFLVEHPDHIGHLFMADFKNFKMDLRTFKRAVSMGQKYGVWIHHRDSIVQAMDALIDIIRNPPAAIQLDLPVQKTKKDPFLIDVFSRIPSVSKECAEAVIPMDWHTIKDLFRFNEAEYRLAINAFYERDMKAILQNIVKKMGF